VTIGVEWPGASPQEVERELTQPIEEAVGKLPGVRSVRSQSRKGRSIVTVEFAPAHHRRVALRDVSNALTTIRELPEDSERPVLSPIKPDALPLLWLVVHGSQPVTQLSEVAQKTVRPKLLTISQVAGVELAGLHERILEVYLDPVRLAAFAMTASDVLQAIRKSRVDVPGAAIKSPSRRIVRSLGQPSTAEDLGKIVILVRKEAPIFLRQVAAVTQERKIHGIARFNGKPAVGLALFSFSDDPAALVASVKKALPGVRASLPEGVKLDVALDYQPGGQEALLVEVRFPPGTGLERANALLARAENILTGLKDPLSKKAVIASRWATLPVEADRPRDGAVYVQLVPARQRSWTSQEVSREVRRRLKELPGIQASVWNLSEQGSRARADVVEAVLTGPDLEQLARWSQRVQQKLSASEMVVDVVSDLRAGEPEMHVEVDREKAARLGITIRQINEVLQLALDGVVVESAGDDGVNLRVRMARAKPEGANLLEQIPVPAAGMMIPLSTLAHLRLIKGTPVIHRHNGWRSVTLRVHSARNIKEKKLEAACRGIAAEVYRELALPASYRVAEVSHP
jgi:multidrug efflux pump subunit AcrB